MEKYFTYILGTLLATFGLILFSLYIALFSFSPVIENIFSIDMNISSALLVISLSYIIIGFSLGFYSISKDKNDYSNLWIIISLMFSIISFFYQLIKLSTMGPTWIGIEFFGINGNRIEAMYIDMMLFLSNLVIMIICSTITLKNYRGE